MRDRDKELLDARTYYEGKSVIIRAEGRVFYATQVVRERGRIIVVYDGLYGRVGYNHIEEVDLYPNRRERETKARLENGGLR
jgi:hypothetical protein